MNESLLRWKGRIGALKPLAFFIAIFLVIFLFPVGHGLLTAVKNPSGAQTVSIAQLVSDQVGTNRYVTVTGTASYKLAYTETDNGSTIAVIYPLIDGNDHVLVFVRTTHTEVQYESDAQVTITGMTISSSTELTDAITKDLADINSAGFQTSKDIYIEEGQKPGNLLISLVEIAALGFSGLLCIITFLFPSTVFGPFPVQSVAPGTEIKKGPTKATGTFQQVNKMQPLEFGRTKRKFQSANANLFFAEDNSLGVYIHFVFTQRVYGIQVRKQETDWMILVKPSQIIAIEPGKLYAWRDTWAVSVRYKDSTDKNQTLLISFDSAALQADFVDFLRKRNYAVSSGQYPVSGSAWS
jgi:hypothetical protein